MTGNLRKFNRKCIFFALPGLLGFAIFYLLPFAVTGYYSTINNTREMAFVGLGNYFAVLANEYYLLALRNTLIFSAASVLCLLALSLLFAALISQAASKASGFFRSAFMLPVFIPTAAIVTFWRVIFNEETMFSGIGWLSGLGGTGGVGNAVGLASWVSLFLLFIWKNLGLNILIFIAGIMRIPKEIIEAAGSDGANSVQVFFRIILPLLIPDVFVVVILSLVQSLRIFREAYLLYGQYPNETIYFLPHFLNNKYLKLDYAELSAGVNIFLLLILLLFAVIMAVQRIHSRAK